MQLWWRVCRVKVWSVQTVTALMGSSGGVNKFAIGARCRHNEYTEGWRHNSAVQQFEDVKPRVAGAGLQHFDNLVVMSSYGHIVHNVMIVKCD